MNAQKRKDAVINDVIADITEGLNGLKKGFGFYIINFILPKLFERLLEIAQDSLRKRL